ncbi:MAG: FG-GAP repeat protein [candidate division BRC1 bacterium ADurb.BinA292]|nr:MAG: FG-GAP repeat protein [candidate division BRC1 bacterium ADurb.BinA292]
MLSVFSPGDFTGDGKPDLIARQNNGVLWLYSGAGSGTWAEPIQIGTGWAQMTALFGPGDMNGDGNPDVLARHSSGALLLYTGNGSGGWRGQSQIGQGWNVMSWIG